MARKLSKLQSAQREAEEAAKRTNVKIEELGDHTGELYESLGKIQALFDCIRNVPGENQLKYEDLKAVRVSWQHQVEKIEIEYKSLEAKAAGQGAAGVGAGIAVAAFGPTAAMGIATTFGVASTGTAISTLSGAAATKAALAWLGGGALAMGGGGIAAGKALLAFTHPAGLAIACIAAIASGVMFFRTKGNKERLENIYTLISNRDVKSCEMAVIEIDERIERIKIETAELVKAIARIETFGTDYKKMAEAQQYELGSYVNLMESATALLVNPILGLQPKYTEQDFEKMCMSEELLYRRYFMEHRDMIISMANLLYKIKLNEKDRRVLAKALRNNKEFLQSINMSKQEFDKDDIALIERALNYRYEADRY